MATFPSFSFPSQRTQASGAFAPAQIDFSKISQIADTYYDAQNDRLKRDAFKDQQAAQQAERARQDQVRQVFAQGLPRDAQGNIDYAAASERLLALDPSQGVDFLKIGSQEADRRHSRAFDEKKFASDQAYRQQQIGLQREQMTPANVRQYQFYAQQEREAGREPMPFNDWTRQPAPGTGKFGVNPVYGVDANGNPVIIQLGSDGTTRQATLPEGVSPLGPGETAEARARGGVAGKSTAEAQKNMPAVKQSAAEMLGALNALENDPHLDRMLGFMGSRTPDLTTDARRALSKIEQIGGQAFLTAFEKLKGGGQITEIEGTKGTQAITRLGERGMSPQDYRAAINDLRNVVKNVLIRARVDAGELGPEALNELYDFESLGMPEPAAAPATNSVPATKKGPQRRLDMGDGFSVEIE